jgi:hypothetical protein
VVSILIFQITYDRSGGDALPGQVIVRFLKSVERSGQEGRIALSHVHRDETDTGSRYQVPVEPGVADL